MATYWKQWLALSAVSVLMTACQSIDTFKLKHAKEEAESKSNALIYCAGTPDCQFERLDRTMIVDESTKRISPEALDQRLVRLQAKNLKQDNPIYLSVPEGQHELVVRFYPISKDKAETLHLFQQFKANKRYTLKMFRDRNARSTSLLNASAPDPLCVDLLQEQKVIRRFCKPYNVINGIAEFVEKKI
ncbi:hypothetical protein [Acinetobacter variabilis]|uniref:hypothetical protein n=1 Tax=Acinetobacter variabilis TaxID=70346 RepID=UPI0021C03A37|nr:hypothetical protein [Acinetobacter variabilis]UXI51126.1 hypothetical protein N5980_13565 [Acinetobacter variabilis]